MKKAVWALIAAFLLLQLATAARAGDVVGPAVRMPFTGGGSGGSSTLTSGTTATSGCVAGGVLRSISNLVECGAGLTYASSIFTVGTGASSTARKMEVANGTSASTALALTHSSTTTSFAGIGLVDIPLVIQNTSNTDNNFSFVSFLTSGGASAAGILAKYISHAGQSGSLGLYTRASGGSLTERLAIGADGAVVIGTGLTGTAAPLTIDNGTSTGSPLVVQDNGTPVLTVADGGNITLGTNSLTANRLVTSTGGIDLNPAGGGGGRARVLLDDYSGTIGLTSLISTTISGGPMNISSSSWWKIGAKALVAATPTAFVRVAVTSNGRQGGVIEYCVDADDATSYQTRCGSAPFAFINNAGTETCTVGTPADVLGGAGTLTVAFTTTTGTDTCDILGDAASSLVETTLRINYTVRLFGNAATAITAQ